MRNVQRNKLDVYLSVSEKSFIFTVVFFLRIPAFQTEIENSLVFRGIPMEAEPFRIVNAFR